MSRNIAEVVSELVTLMTEKGRSQFPLSLYASIFHGSVDATVGKEMYLRTNGCMYQRGFLLFVAMKRLILKSWGCLRLEGKGGVRRGCLNLLEFRKEFVALLRNLGDQRPHWLYLLLINECC